MIYVIDLIHFQYFHILYNINVYKHINNGPTEKTRVQKFKITLYNTDI